MSEEVHYVPDGITVFREMPMTMSAFMAELSAQGGLIEPHRSTTLDVPLNAADERVGDALRARLHIHPFPATNLTFSAVASDDDVSTEEVTESVARLMTPHDHSISLSPPHSPPSESIYSHLWCKRFPGSCHDYADEMESVD